MMSGVRISAIRRWPWLTLSLVAAALLAASVSGADLALEYRRSAVQAGQLWRLLTGQLVHWTARMTATDLGVLLALGAWMERRCRRLAAASLAGAAVLVGIGVHVLSPGLDLYRGSSGLASALFVATALDLARGPGRRSARAAAAAVLSLFALKILWELWTGRALAAGALLPGVSVLPLVHLLGGAAGVLACAGDRLFRRRGPRALVSRRVGRREAGRSVPSSSMRAEATERFPAVGRSPAPTGAR